MIYDCVVGGAWFTTARTGGPARTAVNHSPRTTHGTVP
jgi:hypothetical protein